MAKAGDIPLEQKPRVWEQCGCCFVLLKPHPKYKHLILVVVAENCGQVIDGKDHNEREKGKFRSFQKDRVVRYDALADELMRKFGGTWA